MNSSKQDQIVSLSRPHVADIEALLQLCDLPFEDCRLHLDNFVGIILDGKLIATGALQYEGSVALLRSIAVHPDSRGRGLAGMMTRHLLEQARASRVKQLYILTETAETYFTRFEFYSIRRQTVPVSIQATQQFESLCPASAQAMRLDL
jgi:amino-acid N-acetyltransferase